MTIAGRERVMLQVRSATATVQFNSLNEVLRDLKFDGKPVKSTASDDEKQLTTLTLTAPATVDTQTLAYLPDQNRMAALEQDKDGTQWRH